MLVYQIVFTRQAAKALRRAPHDIAAQIRKKLDEIAKEPFVSHPNTAKLQGRPGYRLRVGDWRVIYEIQREEVVIIVLKVAPRGEV